jgi:uncharacterized protein with FMN-binding domain
LKCTEVCPRNNAKANILGQDVNPNLAGSVAMASMLAIYGITNFEADALTKSGMILNNNATLSDATSNNASQKYKDGTYTGSGKGFGGTTKVSVTIADGKITNIEVLSNQDDRQYFDRASGTIIKNMLSNQSASVNTVSGATFSSKGIISAVKDALNQAGVSDLNSDTTDNTSVTAEPATSNATATENIKSEAANTVDISKTASSKYKNGTYTGTGTGFDGAITKMSVTIANGKIANIKTVSNGDTPEFYNQASNGIINKIISNQSASVDTVSGATFSSNGIISAVKNALSQAAGSNSKVDQGSTSSNSAANNSGTSNTNATKNQPTTPPPVENQNSTTTQSPPQTQNSTATQPQKSTPSTATQGSTNTTTSSTSSKGQYKDGTYTGSGSGFGGTT